MSKTLIRASERERQQWWSSDQRFVRPQNKVDGMKTNRRCLDCRVNGTGLNVLLKVASFNLKVRVITGLKISSKIANFEVSIVIPSFKIKLDITSVEIGEISTLERFCQDTVAPQ